MFTYLLSKWYIIRRDIFFLRLGNIFRFFFRFFCCLFFYCRFHFLFFFISLLRYWMCMPGTFTIQKKHIVNDNFCSRARLSVLSRPLPRLQMSFYVHFSPFCHKLTA